MAGGDCSVFRCVRRVGLSFTAWRFAQRLHGGSVRTSAVSLVSGARAAKLCLGWGGAVIVREMKNRLGWLGRMHRFVSWTAGCVAVTDQEIEEIVRVVPVGTSTKIEP